MRVAFTSRICKQNLNLFQSSVLPLIKRPLLTRTFHSTKITMVEGHQCHRIAHAHRQKLLGKKFTATSPNQRFVDGAAAINNKTLQRIEVHGKNLFYFFSDTPVDLDVTNAAAVTQQNSLNDTTITATATTATANNNNNNNDIVVLLFHFGMSGTFLTASITPTKPPPTPKPTCRLQLLNRQHNIVAQLSAMTVRHGGLSLYFEKTATLGEDPLRPNANPELVWTKIKASKKPIGLLLMSQDVIAGVGNIYRAEILFKSKIHPEQPGYTLTRQQFDTIWAHSYELLHKGFTCGSIITVDEEEAILLGKPWTRRYVYNHSTCGRCLKYKGLVTNVTTWDMNNRTVYACLTCQPLVEASSSSGNDGGGSSNSNTKKAANNNELLPKDRRKALQAATAAKPFVSHCAPDTFDDIFTTLSTSNTTSSSDATVMLSKLTVAVLKSQLNSLGLAVGSGKKAVLVERLIEFYFSRDGGMGDGVEEEVMEKVEVVFKTPGQKNEGRLVDNKKKKKNKSSDGSGENETTVRRRLLTFENEDEEEEKEEKSDGGVHIATAKVNLADLVKLLKLSTTLF